MKTPDKELKDIPKYMYYVPEAIGAIFWLLMDYSWLSKSFGMAIMFSIGAITMLGIAAANTFFNKTCPVSERLNFLASWTWCLMNSFWLISELPVEGTDSGDASRLALLSAKLFFIVSSALVLSSIVFSMIEKSQLNFKRLKLTFKSDATPVEEKTVTIEDKLNQSLNNSNLKVKAE